MPNPIELISNRLPSQLGNLNLPRANPPREPGLGGVQPGSQIDIAHLQTLGIHRSPEQIASSVQRADEFRAMNDARPPHEQVNILQTFSPEERHVWTVRTNQAAYNFHRRLAQGVPPAQAHRQTWAEFAQNVNRDFEALGSNSLQLFQRSDSNFEGIGNSWGTMQLVRQRDAVHANPVTATQSNAVFQVIHNQGHHIPRPHTWGTTRAMVQQINNELSERGVNDVYVVPGQRPGFVHIRSRTQNVNMPQVNHTQSRERPVPTFPNLVTTQPRPSGGNSHNIVPTDGPDPDSSTGQARTPLFNFGNRNNQE